MTKASERKCNRTRRKAAPPFNCSISPPVFFLGILEWPFNWSAAVSLRPFSPVFPKQSDPHKSRSHLRSLLHSNPQWLSSLEVLAVPSVGLCVLALFWSRRWHLHSPLLEGFTPAISLLGTFSTSDIRLTDSVVSFQPVQIQCSQGDVLTHLLSTVNGLSFPSHSCLFFSCYCFPFIICVSS